MNADDLRILCIPGRDDDDEGRWFVVDRRTQQDWPCWSRQDAAETRRALLAGLPLPEVLS